ncbi:MAG: hypothetical protein RMJ48_12035 [Roseiflexaceae bacterium]|nr:hypothetical protein [Roseiflexaceae bacterium]
MTVTCARSLTLLTSLEAPNRAGPEIVAIWQRPGHRLADRVAEAHQTANVLLVTARWR